jgi:acetyl-CoA C-acetyltransferase
VRSQQVGIVAVGQTDFVTRRTDVSYPELVREGVSAALGDGGLAMDDIDAVVFPLAPDALIGVGNGERWCVEAIGATGKPFMRVNNGGATGLTAVHAAWSHVASGMFDAVLVCGADRVSESGSAQSVLNKMWDVGYERPYPLNTINMLALSASRYMHLYGSDERDMARVSVKNRRHAGLNRHAHLRAPLTEEEVLGSRTLSWPIKLGDACPSSTGAAAVVLASEDFCRKLGKPTAWIRGMAQNCETFWMGDRVGAKTVGDHGDADALSVAFQRAYAQAGIVRPAAQIDVAELYAPFSNVELHAIEAALLCGKGEAPRLIEKGHFALGSPGTVVNPSGGVLCTNPIAVTGTIRVIEAALQVLGRAGDHQVDGARVGIASAIGGDHQFYSTAVVADTLEVLS